ncbi:hypothetical protein CDV31_002690 [Fusarium ambrosium]|uniref:DNA2/NAM7 helicase-like C-terminal domain-containing protein n=1 Tax=Fusarium ambrosium TaxID=131363 RepID=A0A428UWA0_9HYPO|nr:hypothetical protein CDV31_002690 [Fusarium ambrosium]
MEFPMGSTTEDDGFGICHRLERRNAGLQVPTVTDTRTIRVKFPRGSITYSVDSLDDDKLQRLFPAATRLLSIVRVSLKPGSEVTVEGYGLPFANPGHPSEGWLNKLEPIVGDKTLVDILMQRDFTFIVHKPSHVLRRDWNEDQLPPPFSYPYGTLHDWDMERFDNLIKNNKGHQFWPAWTFDDQNSHTAALVQSQIQDVRWLCHAAEQIAEQRFLARFVTTKEDENAGGDELSSFAIISLTGEFLNHYDAPLRHLIRDQFLTVELYNKPEDEGHATSLDARIVAHPTEIEPPLKNFRPAGKDELILQVRNTEGSDHSRAPIFGNWIALRFSPNLNETKRKVDAVCSLQSGRRPSNLLALDAPKLDNYPTGTCTPANELEFRMSLHRALVLGSGFWSVLRDFKPLSVSSPATVVLPCVPDVNLLDIRDATFMDALMMEILPTDRDRFRQYFSKRALGLGLMTAGPGFGKTTALSVATLGMGETLGPIFASAPTHVAVNTFAARLYAISSSLVNRYNKDKKEKDHVRRKLVVRGYDDEEYEAFQSLLRDPKETDDATSDPWKRPGRWNLHLSKTHWLLMCLRSRAVPSMHPCDSIAIHRLQRQVDKDSKLVRLRRVASGTISWEEYANGKMVDKNVIEALFRRILEAADIVCTTPAQSCGKFYRNWKKTKARGFAVDEAANMTRPDLYSLWGNTMMPCILAGDEKQLPPAVISLDEKDSQGNAINRLGRDAKISPLEFFQGLGMPVYRLRTQLRMAHGLFDLSKRFIYPDVDCTYGPGCSIELDAHRIGRDIEFFVLAKYPQLNAAPTGSLQPIFIHCEGSHCHTDPITKSKSNRDQVIVALDFILGFISSTARRVQPSQIIIITPYTANMHVIEEIRKRPKYASLASMKPAKTISSFQGQESDIVVAIMATTKQSGPGMTTDEHQLNVMLSRHRSGLIIVGDIYVTGRLGDERNNGRRQVQVGRDKFQVRGTNREVSWVSATVLRSVHQTLWDNKRVNMI